MFKLVFSILIAQVFVSPSYARDTGLYSKVDYHGHQLHEGLPAPYKTMAITPDNVHVKMTYAENKNAASDKPVFLFVHGMVANKHNWQDGNPEYLSLLELIWKSGFETATMHYRGHGGGDQRSLAPKKSAFHFLPWKGYIPGNRGKDVASSTFYGPDRMVMDVVAAVEKIYNENGGRRVVLVGHSMGEMIPKLVLSGVRYDVRNGESYELSPRRAKAWVEKYIHKVNVSSKVTSVTLRDGRVIRDIYKVNQIRVSKIDTIEYANNEVIRVKRGQSQYDVGNLTMVNPFSSNGKLKLFINYASYPGLIGNGGPAEFDNDQMGPMIGNKVTPKQIERLGVFLKKAEPFLNWLASPNHNKSWWESYKDLPLNRLSAKVRGKLLSPITGYTVQKGEERAFKALSAMLQTEPEVEGTIRKVIEGMIGPSQNFDFSTDELPELLKEGGSGMSFSVVLSLMNWIVKDYESRDGKVKYAFRRLFADMFAVRGDVDIATPMLSVYKELYNFGNMSRYLIMKNTGHLGILVRQRRYDLYSGIMEFINNPKTPKYNAGRELPSGVMCSMVFANF